MGLEKLFYVVQKNLRLVFRNWTSFLLLVLGPMLLILIVGFAFSGDDLHDITIGLHAPRGTDVSTVVDSLASDEVGLLFFPHIDRCITAMNHSTVHICADFAPDFGEESGEITFYYDATRYNLVRYILEYLQEQISITSEEISLQLAEQIFADIEGFVTDMEDAQVQVQELRDNALLLREDLVSLYEDVVHAREQFEPNYFKVKELQDQLNSSLVGASEEYAADADIATVLVDLASLDDAIAEVRRTVQTVEDTLGALGLFYDPGVFNTLYTSLDEAEVTINETLTYLETTEDLSSLTLAETYIVLDEINEIVGYLDEMYDTFLMTEETLAGHIENIDSGVEDLDGLSQAFDSYIEEFSGIDEEDAERFLHPISATFVAVPSEETTPKIQLVFPMLLVFMIAFISVLLSNMLVLNETHSPAYFRNFLVPVNNFYFIVGLFLTNLLLIGFQIAVLLVVAYLSFGVNFLLNLPVFVLALLMSTVVFVEIGMIFGYAVPARQTSLLLSLFFSLIVFFFSDIVFPIEIMPEEAAFVAQFSPLVIAEAIFRRVLFFGHSIADQFFGFGVLLLYAVVLAVFVAVAYYWNRSRR
jgi:ABC-type multidrug transport system permease subunit